MTLVMYFYIFQLAFKKKILKLKYSSKYETNKTENLVLGLVLFN